MPEFGRAARRHWNLPEDGAFLNHGSFGACPKAVLAEQARISARMERQPDAFFRNEVMPGEGESALRAAAARLAAFVDAKPANVAFVENATVGIQAVLRSVALAPGDEILVTDHTYNAVRLMVEARCAETGAEPRIVRIAIPATADEIVDAVKRAMTPAVRLAILDHITSPTAIVVPLERIVAELKRAGARVLVDGAHGVGQLPLSMTAIAADWYVSNCHKWLFAPRGTAFLFASDEVAPITRPPVVSHFVDMGFPRSFDWIGTRDYSAWLSVPAALGFHADLDPPAARAYQAHLLDRATELFAPMGIEPVAARDRCAAMRSFVLPVPRPVAAEDANDFMRQLWERERVQSMAVAFGDRLLMRISAQAYVDEEDLRRLKSALERHVLTTH